MAHLFQHGYRIGIFFGILTQIHQGVEQLVHIGQIEIPGHHQIPGPPVILTHYRVQIGGFVDPKVP